MESSRLFFALWPDESTRAKVAGLAERFHGDYGGKQVMPESLHMTLAFLGETLNSRLLELEAIGNRINIPAFTVTLDYAGAWRGGIFWLAPSESPPALMDLVSLLRNELKAEKFSFDDKCFTPHMTLLRGAENATRSITFTPISFIAEDFALVRTVPRKRGVRHEIIARFPLH